MKNNNNIKLQRVVVIAGFLLLTAKFAAFLLTKSNAILTDALESIVNVIAGIIGLYSLNFAAKPRDEDHPYGHGKIEFISASIEGTMILIAGIVIIGKTIYSFFYPHHLQQLNTGIMIIAAAGAVNFTLGIICERQGKKNDSLALTASGKHLQSDAWSTGGIIFALVVIHFTGFTILDNLVAIGMGIFISIIGYRLVRKAIAGIMDEADYDLLKKIISHLNLHRRESWIDLHNMRVIKYGSVLHIDCHFTVPWYYNVKEAHDQVEAMNREVENVVSNPLEFFIHTNACVPPHSCKVCLKNDCNVRQAAFENKVEWNLETSLRNKKHGL
ncbi:MAG: cation diffusion facilitator family transporter [Chitinophagales bacterium]|nr:cation diffusion facilitator family transporter [Chitinophagales bacterium]